MSVEPVLSEREQEILKLVATGASNKEIAQQLVISPNTVKVHLRNIFSKIGVVSRTEATLYALRENLIRPNGLSAQLIESGNGGIEVVKPLPWFRQGRFQVVLAAVSVLLLAAVIFFAVGGDQILRPATPQPAGLNQLERWTVLSNLPRASSGMAAVQYENTIFIIGGRTQGNPTGSLLRYDAASDTWSGLAEKPTPVSGAAAGVIGEKIYIPGGLGDNNQPVDVVEVYNPRVNAWTQATHLPRPLSDYALAAFEGRLFLFGGWDGKEYSDRVYVYDPLVNQWAERKPMDKAFGGEAAVVSGSKIYLIGGTDGTNLLSDLRVYFPNRETASEPAWEARAALPEPLVGASAVALVNGLYTTGGSKEGDGSFKMYRYDEQSNDWAALEDAPVTIGAQSLLIVLDTKIHLLGGMISGAAQPAHLAYQAVYTVLIPAISR